jgi:hypothetical protein
MPIREGRVENNQNSNLHTVFTPGLIDQNALSGQFKKLTRPSEFYPPGSCAVRKLLCEIEAISYPRP